jgi:hypothetical protein
MISGRLAGRLLAFGLILAAFAAILWMQNPAFLSTGNVRARR